MRKSGNTGKAIALFVLLGGMATSLACPVCDTETGQEVRAKIFGEEFGWNMLAVMAPVPLLLVSSYAVSNWLGKEERRT